MGSLVLRALCRSIANLYGMLVARSHADPQCRTRGAAGGPTLVAFVSDQAHYSYQKAAMVLVRCCGSGGCLIPLRAPLLSA